MSCNSCVTTLSGLGDFQQSTGLSTSEAAIRGGLGALVGAAGGYMLKDKYGMVAPVVGGVAGLVLGILSGKLIPGKSWDVTPIDPGLDLLPPDVSVPPTMQEEVPYTTPPILSSQTSTPQVTQGRAAPSRAASPGVTGKLGPSAPAATSSPKMRAPATSTPSRNTAGPLYLPGRTINVSEFNKLPSVTKQQVLANPALAKQLNTTGFVTLPTSIPTSPKTVPKAQQQLVLPGGYKGVGAYHYTGDGPLVWQDA